jgi:hypothetical protein
MRQIGDREIPGGQKTDPRRSSLSSISYFLEFEKARRELGSSGA